MKARRRDDRPNASEQARVEYPTIRDRFLSRSEQGDYVEWLCEVGRFVHHCWLLEEQGRAGAALDERAVWDKWDLCTERDLRQLREDALVKLHGYGARRLWSDAWDWMRENGWSTFLRGLGWTLQTMLAGFVSGIGLIVLGLILAALEPRIVRSLRGAVDDALPAATAPGCPAGHTHTSDPAHC